jgi:hypothetical protein
MGEIRGALRWNEVLEHASDSTIEFIYLLGDTGSWLGAATWQETCAVGGWQQSQIRIWTCRQAPIEILGGLWMKCVKTLCSNFDVGHSNLVWPCQSSYGFRGPTFRTHLGHMRRTDTILCNVQTTMLSFCHSYAPKPSKTNFQAMAPVFRFTRIHCGSFHAHPQTFMCVHCL